MAVYESQQILLENADETISLLLGDLNLSEVTPDERVAIQDWHKGIQQALKAMRFPE